MPVDNNGSHVNKGSIHFLLNRDDIPPSRQQTPTTTTADEFRAIPRSHNTFHTPAHFPDSTTGRGNVLLLREEITEQRTTTTVTRRSVYAQPAPASTGGNFSYNAQGGPLAAAGSGSAYPTGSGGSAGGALPPALTLTPTPHQQPRSSNKGKGPKQGSVLIVPNTYNAGPASSSGADAAQQTDEPEDNAVRKRRLARTAYQHKIREQQKATYFLADGKTPATPAQVADPEVPTINLYQIKRRAENNRLFLEDGTLATHEDVAAGKKTLTYLEYKYKRHKAKIQESMRELTEEQQAAEKAIRAQKVKEEKRRYIEKQKATYFLTDEKTFATPAQVADPEVPTISLYQIRTRARGKRPLLEDGTPATLEDVAAGKKTITYSAYEYKRRKERVQESMLGQTEEQQAAEKAIRAQKVKEENRRYIEKQKAIHFLADGKTPATPEQVADPEVSTINLYQIRTRARSKRPFLEDGTPATLEDVAAGKKTTSYAAFYKRARRAKASTQDAQQQSNHTEHTNNNGGTANSAGAGAGPANTTSSSRTATEPAGSAAAIVRRFTSSQ